MTAYRFFHQIEVRYADIDAQHHVNNAVYFTYMEQARARYFEELELWADGSFEELGVILGEASCRYIRPIEYRQPLQVGAATVRLGNKSFDMVHSIQDEDGQVDFAAGRVVLVAYDYGEHRSIRLPDQWRAKLSDFEDL